MTQFHEYGKAMTALYGKELADDRDRWKREALAARARLDENGGHVISFDQKNRDEIVAEYKQARAANGGKDGRNG